MSKSLLEALRVCVSYLCTDSLLGVTAAFIVLAAFLCGKEDVSLYDGSWIEFYLRAPPELMEDVPDVIPPKD